MESRMLVLSRSKDESVMLGDELEVTVLKVRAKRALLVVYRAVKSRRLMWDASEPRWFEVSDHLDLDDDISCEIVDIRGERVCLGFRVPPNIRPHRPEVYDVIRRGLGR